MTSWPDDVFVFALNERFGAADERSVNFMLSALDDTRGVISQDQMNGIVVATPHLPLQLLARWSAEEGGYIDEVLRNPWQHFGRQARKITPNLERLKPPAMIYIVDHPQFYGGHTLISLSAAAVAADPPIDMPGHTYKNHIHLMLPRQRHLA